VLEQRGEHVGRAGDLDADDAGRGHYTNTQHRLTVLRARAWTHAILPACRPCSPLGTRCSRVRSVLYYVEDP
jgi:hypothetical protein